MKNKDVQWQGFQTAHQDCVIKIQIKQPAISQFSYNNRQSTQADNKKNIHIRKRKKQRSKTLIQNPPKQISQLQPSYIRQSKHIKSENKMINSPIKNKKNSIVSVLSSNQYQKIPIAKYNQNLIGQTIIYNGYFPQTTNKYFLNYLHKKNNHDSLINASIVKSSNDLNLSQIFCFKYNKLQFDSKFQSGNLAYVTQNLKIKEKQDKMKEPQQYNLFMKVDTNTYGHRQWFYFSVKSQLKQTVRLNVYRFKKRWSLFQKGMKPYGSVDGRQWFPIGKKVSYNLEQQTQIRASGNPYSNQFDKSPSYFLSFLLELQQNQKLFICSGIPYTYTYLQERLKYWEQFDDEQLQIKTSYINKTFGGISLPILTIGPKTQKNNQQKNIYIVIISRTHPGQTSSSWVMDGLISYLTAQLQSEDLQLMRKFNLIFKIVPMMNPDGVVMGNYRTGVLGQDFNRKFLSSKDVIYPQIASLKKIISTCKKNGTVQLLLDLHGHSVKKNCFIYAPEQAQFQDRLFNKLSQELQHNRYFSIGDCKFKNQIRKIETARVFFQVREQILAMTCENSLGLFFDNKRSHTYQFRNQNWRQFGKSIATSIFSLISQNSAILQEPQKQKTRKSSWARKLEQQQMFFSSQSRSKTCQTSALQDNIKKLDDFQKSQIKISLKASQFTKKRQKLSQISLLNHSNDTLINSKHAQIRQVPEQQDQSINDTDEESQNLPKNQRKKLFAQVEKIISRPNYRKNRNYTKTQELEKKQNDFLKRKQIYDSNSNGVNRFKEYRFGDSQYGMSMTSWERKKMLLGMPKSIRNQIQSVDKCNQKSKKPAVSIRSNSISIGNQLNNQVIDRSKQLKLISSLFIKNKIKIPNSETKDEQKMHRREFSDTLIKNQSSSSKIKEKEQNKKIANHKLIKSSKLQSYFISIRKQINP